MPSFAEFLSGALEQDPRLPFNAFINQLPFGPLRQFGQRQFDPIQGEFLGQLGAELRTGALPTQTFTSFLDRFPLQQRFASQAPSQRGEFSSRFAPRTRHLFF